MNIYHYFSDNKIPQSGIYQIINAQGQMMTTFPVKQNDVTLIVPVWDWAKGIYYVQLIAEGDILKTTKIIIQ